MDGSRFDLLARRLARRPASRRGLLAALGLAAVGIGGGTMATDTLGTDRCKTGGRVCTRDGDCCSSTCERITGNATRPRFVCACTPGFTLCGTRCLDITADPRNCGACNRRCKSGETCSAGRCLTPTTGASTPTPTQTPTATPAATATAALCGTNPACTVPKVCKVGRSGDSLCCALQFNVELGCPCLGNLYCSSNVCLSGFCSDPA